MGAEVDRPWTWVDRSATLENELADVGRGPLALDTEADSMHHYREKVCLIQLSFGGRDLLVDPLAGVDLAPLRPVLVDPGTRKILHGADYDIRILHRDYDLEIVGLFDTMIAARLVGERAFGLSALLEKFLDVKLDKKYQRADWSRRPLTPEMESYALCDTRYLEPLARILEERLEQLGRGEWAAEEFRRLENVRWAAERGPEGLLQRLKGVQALDRRQLAVANELVLLRDETARRRDQPLFRVMRDEVLLELVKLGPSIEPRAAEVVPVGFAAHVFNCFSATGAAKR